jgi:ubiquinol-cytochrome c reductase cytochrome c1 subunit
MKKLIGALALCLGFLGSASAASGGVPWDKAPSHGTDMTALQNGAKLFANYCLSCHTANYVRFNRLKDIGLTDQQIQSNLNFLSDKVGNLMQSAIDPRDAKAFFGAAPPDLSVIARSRSGAGGTGGDYIYTLLRSYYRDGTKLTGWNNTLFPAIAMPNPLWQLQGEREPVYRQVESHGHTIAVFDGWKQVKPGTMSESQFDEAVGDLAAYLTWMAEPVRNTRVRIGAWVMLFLAMFTLVAWRLNAAYWKDIK